MKQYPFQRRCFNLSKARLKTHLQIPLTIDVRETWVAQTWIADSSWQNKPSISMKFRNSLFRPEVKLKFLPRMVTNPRTLGQSPAQSRKAALSAFVSKPRVQRAKSRSRDNRISVFAFKPRMRKVRSVPCTGWHINFLSHLQDNQTMGNWAQ